MAAPNRDTKMHRWKNHLPKHGVDEFHIKTLDKYLDELKAIAQNPDEILCGMYRGSTPHHLQLYYIQHAEDGHRITAWEMGRKRFANGWIADDIAYERWLKICDSRYTVKAYEGESKISGSNVSKSLSLGQWRMFGVEDVGDGLEVQICLCARISLEEGGRETIENIHSADREVLGDFLVCELTPEFEKELIVTFEFCRVKRYEQYWFFNIDKIVLGEYPLEKIPEHLHDIVKEARGE